MDITLNIQNMPEVMWEIRKACADMLREEAQGEEPRFARKLLELAALFESGACDG